MPAFDNNPKTHAGNQKIHFSVVPMTVVAELSVAMYEGALKHGRHNYRVAPVHASTYFDATMRHLTAWWEGQDNDPDTGGRLHHLAKAIASLTVLRDAMLCDKFIDDRPPCPDPEWLQIFNEEVQHLNLLYPEPKYPYTAVDLYYPPK